MNQTQDRRIAIVGGGPGGLTAARILQMNGLSVTVFEADASTEARDQGGTLDLHTDSGQAALKTAGLLDAFRTLARYEDQGMRVLEHSSGKPLYEDAPTAELGDRPEIDRKVLRDLLLSSLAPGTVQWGAKLRQVLFDRDGRARLQLQDRVTEPFDLVIGADGAWSKVRAMLSDVLPTYTGTTYIELWIEDADNRHPSLSQLVGHGSMFALHAGKGLIAQRNGNGHIRIYAAIRAPEEKFDDALPPASTPSEIKAFLHREFAEWSPTLRALIDAANDQTFRRAILSMPTDFQWPNQPGLTIIGDAAHVMPPMGVGVNLAMQDAAELAETLIQNQDWTAAISTFELQMQHRGSAHIAETVPGFSDLFADDAPRSILDHMQAVRGE